ncbi:MAG: hypothetical protein WC869_00525 [Phycisphaerae bacterium]|jgi:hypothetical protein
MPADPSTIPASATVTNLLTEPLALAGLKTLAPAEARLVDLAAFQLAQRTLVWNAICNAYLKSLVNVSGTPLEVDDLATGQQGVQNIGGHGTGLDVVDVPGGLGLPASVTITNLGTTPLALAGINPFLTSVTIHLSLLPINQQSQIWNTLIAARDAGLISSPGLTVGVQVGFTGHQGNDNAGGHGNGGQRTLLVAT